MFGMDLLRIYFIQINVKKTRLSLNLIVSFKGSTKFRTDEKGHELKAHDSFFLKIDIK